MLSHVGKAFFVFLLFFGLTASGPAAAARNNKDSDQGKTAIVLASFGSSVPSAVQTISHIGDRIRQAYPKTELRMTFTSNQVRSIWQKRSTDPERWLAKGVSPEILKIKNIIQTIGDLQEDGYRNIIVQPTHMFYMEQSHDLAAYVNGLGSIETVKARWKPFDTLVLGRPALGMPGDRYNYQDDIARLVKVLGEDAKEAKKEGAVLLYMGHGNRTWSTGIYGETQKEMRIAYPDVQTFIGVVEGYPSLEDLMPQLQMSQTKKIILRPFMITAGDHAVNDMAGPDADSWQSILTAAGFTVRPVLEGLGTKEAFIDIFIEHIADAAKEKGLTLH